MSRSGYSDDLDPLELGRYRGRVASAIRGSRGQALLRDMADAMDAMEDKSLAHGVLRDSDGCMCAMGVAMHHRGLEVPVSPDDFAYDFDADWTARQLDIAECLAKEVAYVNDDCASFTETPEQRWARVRRWVAEHLNADAAEGSRG